MNPPTEKQMNFLRSLLAERKDMDGVNEIRHRLNEQVREGRLGKSEVSWAIKELLEIKVGNKNGTITVTEPGFYYVEATTEVFRVVRSKDGNRLYASKLIPATERGKRGRFEIARGKIFELKPEEFLTTERMAQTGTHLGYCLRCGAFLEVENSVKAGFGPDCAKKMGVQWGEPRKPRTPTYKAPAGAIVADEAAPDFDVMAALKNVDISGLLGESA